MGERIEEEGVGLREGGRAGGCGVGAEVGLGKSDGEGGVSGEVESWVSFSPVSGGLVREKENKTRGGVGVRRGLLDNGNVHRCCCARTIDFIISHAEWRYV